MSEPANNDLQTRIEEAVKNPRNLGEMRAPTPSAWPERPSRRHAANVGEFRRKAAAK